MSNKNTDKLLERIRNLMKKKENGIEGYIIPSSDAHASEDLALCDRRRAFISGFDGSAGTAVITTKESALWTDGRYFIQAEQQLDKNWVLMKQRLPESVTIPQWLAQKLPKESRVCFDPSLVSFNEWQVTSQQLDEFGVKLIPIFENLVDQIMDNRPSPPNGHIFPLETRFTGKSWTHKVLDIRKQMINKGAIALILTALDEIAWIFNMRGSDIPYNPVFFAYSVITLENIYLFVDKDKLNKEAKNQLKSCGPKLNIEFKPYNQIRQYLESLISETEGKIWISNTSNYALVSLVPKSRRIDSVSPVSLEKSIKNPTEIESIKHSHVKDAIALCQYYSWLEKEVPKGSVDELSAASQLEELKKLQEDYMGPSFETISSSGSNGAIIHYKPNRVTNRKLSIDEIYLCDCGSQFRDGTTDITRTVHFGQPSDYQKECFTRVVKGHIALASAVFPNKTKIYMLEAFARKHLWSAGQYHFTLIHIFTEDLKL